MNAYTVSRLAADAGVSVHVVRDYVLRGLLQPARRTESGFGVFDVAALQRLRFVRTAFEAGIGLDTLAPLCLALDAPAEAYPDIEEDHANCLCCPTRMPFATPPIGLVCGSGTGFDTLCEA